MGMEGIEVGLGEGEGTLKLASQATTSSARLRVPSSQECAAAASRQNAVTAGTLLPRSSGAGHSAMSCSSSKTAEVHSSSPPGARPSRAACGSGRWRERLPEQMTPPTASRSKARSAVGIDEQETQITCPLS